LALLPAAQGPLTQPPSTAGVTAPWSHCQSSIGRTLGLTSKGSAPVPYSRADLARMLSARMLEM